MTEAKPKKSKQNKETKPIISENDVESDFRILSVLSFFFVLIVLGIPIWWYTTRVYRASLPLEEMFGVELKNKTNKSFGIPLSLEYDVLITLVNPDPANLNIDLNGEDIDVNLQPFLTKISPIAKFVVKSQWLYLVELGKNPRKIDEHLGLFESDLPHIITPLEKKLGSHLSPRPCLNLVVYFPHCKAPLLIYSNLNVPSKTNAFLSPRWGGLTIVNADQASCEARTFRPNLKSIVATFTTQLEKLFNMNNASPNEILLLKQRKTEDMIDSTRRTLKSLAQLLSEISSIVISDEVADKINLAVKHVDLSQEYYNKDLIDEALKHAKIAFEHSEGAFGDSSLLALLYFPDDQKYAVYIPLFLPIMIPVVMSLILVKRWYFCNDIKVKND